MQATQTSMTMKDLQRSKLLKVAGYYYTELNATEVAGKQVNVDRSAFVVPISGEWTETWAVVYSRPHLAQYLFVGGPSHGQMRLMDDEEVTQTVGLDMAEASRDGVSMVSYRALYERKTAVGQNGRQVAFYQFLCRA